MELSDALYLTPATLQGDTVIVVTTLASMRVNATEGRKVYGTNGQLMAHFGDLTEAQKAYLEKIPGTETLAYSLANVFRLHRPIVIMDEAHNARTVLTWESLARFGPSCIIEFTATPDQERQTHSNVLYSVPAAELKAEHMVKLPDSPDDSPAVERDHRKGKIASLNRRVLYHCARARAVRCILRGCDLFNSSMGVSPMFFRKTWARRPCYY